MFEGYILFIFQEAIGGSWEAGEFLIDDEGNAEVDEGDLLAAAGRDTDDNDGGWDVCLQKQYSHNCSIDLFFLGRRRSESTGRTRITNEGSRRRWFLCTANTRSTTNLLLGIEFTSRCRSYTRWCIRFGRTFTTRSSWRC